MFVPILLTLAGIHIMKIKRKQRISSSDTKNVVKLATNQPEKNKSISDANPVSPTSDYFDNVNHCALYTSGPSASKKHASERYTNTKRKVPGSINHKYDDIIIHNERAL